MPLMKGRINPVSKNMTTVSITIRSLARQFSMIRGAADPGPQRKRYGLDKLLRPKEEP